MRTEHRLSFYLMKLAGWFEWHLDGCNTLSVSEFWHHGTSEANAFPSNLALHLRRPNAALFDFLVSGLVVTDGMAFHAVTTCRAARLKAYRADAPRLFPT